MPGVAEFRAFCEGQSKSELAEVLSYSEANDAFSIEADGGRCARRLEDGDARVLVDGVMIAGLPLAAVSLRNHALGDAGAHEIARLLKRGPASRPQRPSRCVERSLHRLGGDDGEDVTTEAIAHYSPVVTSLNLRGNALGPIGAASVVAAAQRNATLVSLDLSWNALGKAGGLRIAALLAARGPLKELRLAHASLDLEAVVAVLAQVRAGSPLELLDVSGCIIQAEHQDDIASHAASALLRHAALRSLALDGNRIGDDGCAVLAQALADNDVLESLSLRGNRIRGGGAAALADTLVLRGADGPLRMLDLKSNQITDEGADALADALSRDVSLMSLHVGDNDIGDRGLEALAKALLLNHRLEKLRAWGNHFGPLANEQFHELLNGANDADVALDFTTYLVDGILHTAEKEARASAAFN